MNNGWQDEYLTYFQEMLKGTGAIMPDEIDVLDPLQEITIIIRPETIAKDVNKIFGKNTAYYRYKFRNYLHEHIRIYNFIFNRLAERIWKEQVVHHAFWKPISGNLASKVKPKVKVDMLRRRGLRRIEITSVVHIDYDTANTADAARQHVEYIVEHYGKDRITPRQRSKLEFAKSQVNYAEDVLFKPVEQWSKYSAWGYVRGKVKDLRQAYSYWIAPFETARANVMSSYTERLYTDFARRMKEEYDNVVEDMAHAFQVGNNRREW